MSSFVPKPDSTPPSKSAIIIGAGIAGLTAAAALGKSGFSVNIFEKSQFATETGAALLISPNGAKVLESLGFDFQRAQACRINTWETLHGSDLKRFAAVDFEDAMTRYGQLLRSIHRVDLHNELLRIALGSQRTNVRLHLSSTVTYVDCLNGSVRLADGRAHSADLVVAADGVHSVARDAVAQADTQLKSTEMSAFRFLVDTSIVKSDPVTAELLQIKDQNCTIIADTSDTAKERHMVWYGCRDGTVQNFVGIHPTRRTSELSTKEEMLEEFEHFHSAIARLIDLAEEIKCWPLHSYKPLKTIYRGRTILIGDSAHPMLPFGGQGSNQAIEDAGALGSVLQDLSSADRLSDRLEAFQMLRLNRVSMVQLLSGVRVGRELEIWDQLTPYASTNDQSKPRHLQDLRLTSDCQQVPTSFAERIQHHYGYDILSETRELLELLSRSRSMAA